MDSLVYFLTSLDKFLQRDAGLLGLGAEDGEHEDGGDDRGDEVQAGDDGGGDVHPVLELVVAPYDVKLDLQSIATSPLNTEHEEAAP